MNITRLIITYPFTIGRRNGATRNLYEIVSRLAARGVRIELIQVASESRKAERFPFEPENSSPSKRVQVTDVLRKSQPQFGYTLTGATTKWDGARQLGREVDRLLRDAPADAVLGHFSECRFAQLAARRHRTTFGFISCWQTYDSSSIRRGRNPIATLLNRHRIFQNIIRPHRNADVLFASSNHTKCELQQFVGVDPSRIVVNYFGMDRNFLRVPRVPRSSVSRILYFGRLVESKGIVDAIRALGIVARDGNRAWRFRLFGQGDQDWVRQLAADNGIADLVEVHLPVDDVTLHKELESADLALMPSHHEAFGLSIAEAQAAGLPVIAYKAGSVPEVVVDGVTGWLAQLHDVDGLAVALKQALVHPEITHERGIAARAHIDKTFDWERTVDTMLEQIALVKQRKIA